MLLQHIIQYYILVDLIGHLGGSLCLKLVEEELSSH